MRFLLASIWHGNNPVVLKLYLHAYCWEDEEEEGISIYQDRFCVDEVECLAANLSISEGINRNVEFGLVLYVEFNGSERESRVAWHSLPHVSVHIRVPLPLLRLCTHRSISDKRGLLFWSCLVCGTPLYTPYFVPYLGPKPNL